LPAPPRPPASAEFRIAFESNRDGDDAIFVATADGAVVKRLTAGIRPAWSPDAARRRRIGS
jgi:hypothetical protein